MNPIAGQANTIGRTLVARGGATPGAPITAGTVNLYVVALTGANAGKWFKDSDDSWSATEEVSKAMTHLGDGNWTAAVDAACWTDGVEYRIYARESGDLHVPNGETQRCGPVWANIRQILGTTLTETSAGYLAAAFKKLFDVAIPLLTCESANQSDDAYAAANAAANSASDAATDIAGIVADGVDLTSTQVTALVAAIEAEIANDATGEAIRQAIIDKLLENLPDIDDLTLAAIASACATASRDAILDRVLAGNHDTAGTPGLLLQNLDGPVSAVQTSADAAARPGAEMALVDDAITLGKFDESTAFPLASADTGATAVARTGADADTLETLSDEIAAVALSIEAEAARSTLHHVPSGVHKILDSDNQTVLHTLTPQPVIAVSAANWTNSSKTLTEVGAFADYVHQTGRTITLSAGTGVILGQYVIASRVSADAITLTTDINGAGGDIADTSIAGEVDDAWVLVKVT